MSKTNPFGSKKPDAEDARSAKKEADIAAFQRMKLKAKNAARFKDDGE